MAIWFHWGQYCDQSEVKDTYTVDRRNLRVATTDPQGRITTTVYDPVRRVIGTIDAMGNRTDVQFDKVGRPLSTATPLAQLVFDNFDRALVGPGWTAQSGTWEIISNRLHNFDEVEGSILTNNTDPVVSDYFLQSIVNAANGAVHLGLVGRYVDINNYYYVDIRPGTGAVQLRRKVLGVDTLLASVTLGALAGDRLVRFSLVGSILRAFVDGVQVLAVLDTSIVAAGRAGVRMGAGGTLNPTVTAVWDDFLVVILTQRQTVYDAGGLVLAEIDELGFRTSFVYDDTGRRVAQVDALGNRTTTVYDTDSLMLAQVDALDGRTSFSYDRANRLTETINALGNVATTVYNPVGTVRATINEVGCTTTMAYDRVDRLIARMDGNGFVTSTLYDPAGRTVATIDAEGFRTSFSYDRASRRIALTDANSHVTSFLFDVLGRDVGGIDPLGRRTTFAYDTVGNRVLKISARGHATTFTYDDNNRPTGERFDDGTRNTFTYDLIGNRLTSGDSTGTYTMTYSARNEVLSVRNPDDKLVQYSYDGIVNRRKVMTDADGGLFSYTYDAKHRLIKLLNPRNETTSMAYDAIDRMTRKVLANGSVTSHTYDAANRLTYLRNTQSDGTPISGFSYTYDCTGNRRSVLELDGARVTWSYDRKYQLRNEQRTDPGGGLSASYNATFTYDGVGNRLVQNDGGALTTYVYDIANELLTQQSSGGTTSFSYDLCGNRTVKDDPGAAITYYTWDTQNRLRVAEPAAGAVSFTYNYAHHRVVKQSPSETEKFIYDFEKVLQETDGGNTTTDLFTNTIEEFGDLISQYDGTSSHYHEYDALGSTDALTDPAQATTDEYIYRAYGKVEARSGVTDNDFTFVGRQGYMEDLETELYFARRRYYDPVTGQWISEDPLGIQAGDVNYYRYVGNNPINQTDPSGLGCGWNPVCHAREAAEAIAAAARAVAEAAAAAARAAAEAVAAAAKAVAEAAFKGALKLAGISEEDFNALIKPLGDVIGALINDPGRFFSTLVEGVGEGFKKFGSNLLEYLKDAGLQWLFGKVAEGGIKLPEKFDFNNAVVFFLDLLDLTWDKFKASVGKRLKLSPQALDKVEATVEFFKQFKDKDPVDASLELLKQLQEKVAGGFAKAEEFFADLATEGGKILAGSLVEVILPRLIASITPAGAAATAVLGIYKALKWLFENAKDLVELGKTIVGTVADIAAGQTAAVTEKVLDTLKRLVVPVLSFIAALIGLDVVPKKIRALIDKVKEKVKPKREKAVEEVSKLVKKTPGLKALGKEKGEPKQPRDGAVCPIDFSKKPGAPAPQNKATPPTPPKNKRNAACFVAGTWVGEQRVEELGIDDPVSGLTETEHEWLPRIVRSDPPANFVVSLRVEDDAEHWSEMILRRAEGWLAVHQVEVGGTIDLHMPEMGIHGPARVMALVWSPEPPRDAPRVTGTFTHTGATVWDLQVEGESAPIETTAEHPFWSMDRQDWVAAQDLRVGERLSAKNGRMPRVLGFVRREGTYTVHNVEVAGEHVYRVGELGLLVHNQSAPPAPSDCLCEPMPTGPCQQKVPVTIGSFSATVDVNTTPGASQRSTGGVPLPAVCRVWRISGPITPTLRPGSQQPEEAMKDLLFGPTPSQTALQAQFRTAYDPGHLIAATLGGPHHTYNLVPQRQASNRSEAWYKFEERLRACLQMPSMVTSAIMTVEVEYGNTGARRYVPTKFKTKVVFTSPSGMTGGPDVDFRNRAGDTRDFKGKPCFSKW